MKSTLISLAILSSMSYVSGSDFEMVEESHHDSAKLANLVDAMSEIYKKEYKV
jgi:hypothetical protein